MRAYEHACPSCETWFDGDESVCPECGHAISGDENVLARGGGLDLLAKLLFARPKGHG